MLSRSNKILKAIEISLNISILNESLSTDEKDEIMCKYQIRSSSSLFRGKTSKSVSRVSASQHSRSSLASKAEKSKRVSKAV